MTLVMLHDILPLADGFADIYHIEYHSHSIFYHASLFNMPEKVSRAE